jgi:hypothetical protein
MQHVVFDLEAQSQQVVLVVPKERLVKGFVDHSELMFCLGINELSGSACCKLVTRLDGHESTDFSRANRLYSQTASARTPVVLLG